MPIKWNYKKYFPTLSFICVIIPIFQLASMSSWHWRACFCSSEVANKSSTISIPAADAVSIAARAAPSTDETVASPTERSLDCSGSGTISWPGQLIGREHPRAIFNCCASALTPCTTSRATWRDGAAFSFWESFDACKEYTQDQVHVLPLHFQICLWRGLTQKGYREDVQMLKIGYGIVITFFVA